MKRTLFLTALLFLSAMVLRAIEPDPDLIWAKFELSYDLDYVKFSPDEQFIVGQMDEQIVFFDPENGEELFKYYEKNFSFSRDGSLIASLSRLPKELGQRIILRNYPSLDTFKVIPANNYKSFGHIKLSPDNKIVSVRDKDWRLVLIDIETGEERVLFDFLAKYGNTQYAPAQVNTWDFNIDGTEIAIVGSYHIPPTNETYAGDFIYDLVADSVTHIIGQKGDLRYSPDGSVLALIDQGKKGYFIELYETQNYQFIEKIEMNTSDHFEITFSHDNNYLIAAIQEGQRGLHVYEMFEKKWIKYFPFSVAYCDINETTTKITGNTGHRLYLFNFILTDILTEYESLDEIYPNPADNSIILPLNLNRPGNLIFDITNSTGKVLKSIDNGFFDIGKHEIFVDISFLPRGSYFLTATSNEFTQTFKFIKE